MKKYALLIITLIFKLSLFAQIDLDHLMTEKAPNCEDIEYNCTHLIERFYNERKIDSVSLIINYWEDKCGFSEPIIRIKILISINNRTFSEALYDTTILYYINSYKNRMDYNSYMYYNLYNHKDNKYDQFTKKLANDLIQGQDINSLEFLFCKLYSDDPDYLYNEIQKEDKYNNTNIKGYYFNTVNRYLNEIDIHAALYSGLWIPNDNSAILGIHPIIGIDLGIRNKKFTYNLSLNLKFTSAANKYFVNVDNSLKETNYFSGGYLGLDVERELFRIDKNQLVFLGGLALDGFSTVKTNTQDNNPDNDDGHSINSLNLNLGFGYKFNFRNNSYFGFRAKYNFVQYKNSGGTDLSGNNLSIVFVYGGFTNYFKNSNLQTLNYNQ